VYGGDAGFYPMAHFSVIGVETSATTARVSYYILFNNIKVNY